MSIVWSQPSVAVPYIHIHVFFSSSLSSSVFLGDFYRAMLCISACISANYVVTRCPSVCHTPVLSKFFSQSGSHTIIFFIPHVIATFRRGPPRRMQGVWNNRDFAISRFISQMIQDRAIVTMQCEYETVYIYPSFVTVPFSMTLGDLGWLSEIFNNIKTAIRSWPVSGSTFASYQYHRFCETTNDEC